MIDIFATVIIMVYMKKYVKIIGIGFWFFCFAALLSAQNGTVLFRQTVKVSALSNGVEKKIYSTIEKKKVENQLLLTVTEFKSGDIEIRSDSFKLGKMPFSSLFYCVITGTLDIFTCNLTLAVNGMGKKLTLLLSSNIDDSMDEE